jgi:chromosome segregation ATPase
LPETKSTKKKKKKGGKSKANGEVNQTNPVPEAIGDSDTQSKVPAAEDEGSEPEGANGDNRKTSQASAVEDTSPPALTNGMQKGTLTDDSESPDARFEALVRDRDALRAEVTQLRQSLEQLRAKHETSLDSVKEELQEAQSEKQHAEEQYQTLLGRVNTIKAQLGERLKADAVCLMLLIRPLPNLKLPL